MTETNFQYLSQAFNSDSDDELNHSTNYNEHVQYKSFLDPIHGLIELHPLCVKIIDTPEFQRMRDIQQLGTASYVFHGATHNRFQHSLGVYYLARKYMEKFMKDQPEKNIQEKDILIISIAGLCHDLGHGIKSHLYDGVLLKTVHKGQNWSHEIMSYKILEIIIQKYSLMPLFNKYNLYEDDIHCIYEIIFGCKEEAPNDWIWTGMPGKEFMYQIVANKQNGIDVDKFDYYKRDAYYLGLPSPLIIDRVIQASKIVERSYKAQEICYLDKSVYDIYEFFHTRMSLHKRVYQHKVCKSIERMIVEVLLEAEQGGFVIHYNGNSYKITDLYLYPEVYVRVTDSVLNDIYNSEISNEHMNRSKAILNRVYTRDLYKCVGEILIDKNIEKLYPDYYKNCQDTLLDLCNQYTHEVDNEDIYVDIVSIDYGMKINNPVDNVYFFPKNKTSYSRPISRNQVSNMLPSQYIDRIIRVYTRNPEKLQIIKESFAEWTQIHENINTLSSLPATPTKRVRLEF